GVTIGLAPPWPILPTKTVDPLPTKSASSPWPQASWNSTPPNSLPTTTAIGPAGDGEASSSATARSAAARADPPPRGAAAVFRRRRLVEEFKTALHARCLHRGLDLAVALPDRVHHQPDPRS